MPSPGRNGRVLLKNFSDALERTERGIRDGISHGVIWSGPAALGPHEVILAVADEHERSFHITLRRHFLKGCAVGKRFEAGEILLQLRDIAVPPAAVIHVKLVVLVAEDELIDRL